MNKECSGFDSLINVIAIIFRWRNPSEKFRYRVKSLIDRQLDPRNLRQTGYIKAHEYENAFIRLVKILQERYYQVERQALREKKPVKGNSTLSSMNPYLDTNGIIRQNGRLDNADGLSDREKKPIVWPSDSKMTWKLCGKAHEVTMHGGESMTRQWILSHGITMTKLKTRISNMIRACTTCQAYSRQRQKQLMGALG